MSSDEAFRHRLARLPSPFWGRLGRADALEERGLEKMTKCCRGDQWDLRKQSVKSAAWVEGPPPPRSGRAPLPGGAAGNRAPTPEEGRRGEAPFTGRRDFGEPVNLWT
ncbi:hypothetical protein ROHU_015937 [Labeo rohita]|uniref:Uncharacterized protein n=1 Tax=Labeo rohita TaxID=84645 RepID=A0A498NMD7_LABRO|nr:hypothetical protein ROHU_025826 [Labeo rohita]RXN32949.1 hypothetical protein ROHU_015937 [Labeo rohita]